MSARSLGPSGLSPNFHPSSPSPMAMPALLVNPTLGRSQVHRHQVNRRADIGIDLETLKNHELAHGVEDGRAGFPVRTHCEGDLAGGDHRVWRLHGLLVYSHIDVV